MLVVLTTVHTKMCRFLMCLRQEIPYSLGNFLLSVCSVHNVHTEELLRARKHYTVGPPNNENIGTAIFFHYSEVFFIDINI